MEEKMETTQTERQLINLIAADRLYVPVSSLDGKLKRMRPKLAQAVEMPTTCYDGERVHVRVVEDETMKARGMKEGIEMFQRQYPAQGRILQGMIQETRADKEKNLYFGMNPDCRLNAEDYVQVMQDLGFNERQAIEFYPVLMDVSRRLSRTRVEERSILI